ncbi:hypothetical protein H6A65_07375 [Mediterraneibacter glycyrrhizinilyticus]|uniref:hypothetical protein n=1 Tax=Mediterraneibacter glycyrrhizinilyticus TaxID=342942 RepID=UPI0019618A3B|nr:hypothetical protein [Mediterraneibacter glycyrrhizinilyticus]MBM6751312.1 hypothetical protein [Mediterraneibacter glycyrrhizinilyticus]
MSIIPWEKGKSGNPKGRKPRTEKEALKIEEFKEKLKEYSTEALDVLVDILRYGMNPELRYKVAVYILDKYVGKDFKVISDDLTNKDMNITVSVVPAAGIDNRLIDKEVSDVLSEDTDTNNDEWDLLSDDEQDDWDGWDEDIYIPEK